MLEKKVYERINELLEKKRLTPRGLSEIIGIGPQSVYNYLSGKQKAPMSFVVSVLESFPDVSAEWLLRGEGEMMKPTKQSHYLEMAARVNGTYLASEDTEPATWQDAFALLNDKIDNLSNQLKA